MKKSIFLSIIFWLGVVGLSGWLNLVDEQEENEQLAFKTARAFFQQMLVSRAWNAHHGGIYVLITDEVQPNPYLDDPLRDLVTDKGVRLTKINPAFMTRQIAELSAQQPDSIQFHITSLKPLRPENAATDWEKEWLTGFEQGVPEAGGFFTDGPHTFFRYMAPLKVEDACLKCHAKQGYKVGDIRGGISVTLPLFSTESHTALLVGYGVAATLGVLFIVVGGIQLEKKQLLLLASNQALETQVTENQETIKQLKEANAQIKTLSGIIPICMHCKEIRDDQGYWNQLEKFISENSEAKFTHSICDNCLEKKHPKPAK